MFIIVFSKYITTTRCCGLVCEYEVLWRSFLDGTFLCYITPVWMDAHLFVWCCYSVSASCYLSEEVTSCCVQWANCSEQMWYSGESAFYLPTRRQGSVQQESWYGFRSYWKKNNHEAKTSKWNENFWICHCCLFTIPAPSPIYTKHM